MSSEHEHSVLFAIPSGLSLGGVTTWAVQLANHLARRGVATGIIAHAPRASDSRGGYTLDAAVRVFDLSHLPPMDECLGRSEVFAEDYRRAIDALPGTVVCLPAQMGDCHGLFAAETRARPGRIRVVGWAHLDSPYELRVLERYAPIISRFVGVSRVLEDKLRAAFPVRTSHIARIPYGVELSSPRAKARRGVLRVAYVGRLDEPVKRVGVLPLFAQELSRRGIAHVITVAGDGPAGPSLRLAARMTPTLRVLGALAPTAVGELLEESDVLVLPSRAEGLPLVLQEAMARGCVPVACAAASGVAELIEEGLTGALAPDSDSLGELASNLAFAVSRALAIGIDGLGYAARERIVAGYDVVRCHDAMREVIAAAASDPPRAWPGDVEPAFTSAKVGGSGTVPHDGAERLRRTLAGLVGRRVLLYGAGRHTT
ncbi:MAG: glycosyltransferase family 4 protein, partial [Phycisphaerales bacterium]